MYQVQVNPWSKLDRQMIIGMLKATNSTDVDVIYGQKMNLLQQAKILNMLGMILMAIGGVFLLTIILAIGGVIFIAGGWWIRGRFKYNRDVIERAYEEYVASLKTA